VPALVVAPAASAVGRLEPDGAWIGFAPDGQGGYRLVRGDGADAQAVSTKDAHLRGDLLALTIAYFAEVFADAPPELEATRAEVAELIHWLHATAPDAAQARQLQEALDGVDDGLAADVLIARLTEALVAADPGEPVDPVARLVERYRS
jgi:hypothetical protein